MAFRIELLPPVHTLLSTLPPSWRQRALEELRAHARASDGAQRPRRLDGPARCCVHVGPWRFTLLIDHALATLKVVALDEVALDEVPPSAPALSPRRPPPRAPAAR